MDGVCLAEPEPRKLQDDPKQDAGVPFFLLPSVGTWLQVCRPGCDPAPCAVAETATEAPRLEAAKCVEDAGPPVPARSRHRSSFCLKPSVGTWLAPRLDEDSAWFELSSAKVVEEPTWEADFDAFLSPPKGNLEDAPLITAVIEPPAEKSSPVMGRQSGGAIALLTPPPPPTSRCAVQAAVRAADVVVIEGLEEDKLKPKAEAPKEEKAAKPPRRSLSTTEELIGTNRAPDDDEELLLGDDAVGPIGSNLPRRPPGDGVDSASESDIGEQRLVAARTPAPLSAPQRAAVPPSDAGSSPQQEPSPAPDGQLPAQGLPPTGQQHPEAQGAAVSSTPPREGTPIAPQPSKQAPLPSTSVPAAATRAAQQPSAASSGRPAAWTEVDSQVAKRLDTFFSDRNAFDRVNTQCNTGGGTSLPSSGAAPARSTERFRVRVPAPHPGLQYRRSKCLTDRHQRYLENGSTVTGQVEDDGTWLRLSEDRFLPMRIDGNQVLVPLPPGADAAGGTGNAGSSSPNSQSEQLSWIWGWCTGCRDSVSMVDADILVRGDTHAGAPANVPTSFSSR